MSTDSSSLAGNELSDKQADRLLDRLVERADQRGDVEFSRIERKAVELSRRGALAGAASLLGVGALASNSMQAQAATGSWGNATGSAGTQSKPLTETWSQDVYTKAIDTEQETLSQPVVRGWGDSGSYKDYPIETEFVGSGDVSDAIASAQADGAVTLELPKGLWRYDSTIVPALSNLIIRGTGSQQGSGSGTILSYKGAGTAIDATVNDSALVLENVWLGGPDSTGTTVGIDSTSSVKLTNSRVSGFGTGWVAQDGTYYTAAINSAINDNGDGLVGGANTMCFVNTLFNTNNNDGIRTENTVRSFHAWGCSMEGNGGWGVHVTNNVSAPIGPVTVQKNYIENNGSGGSGGGVRLDGNVQSSSVTSNYLNNHDDGVAHIQIDDSNRTFVGYNKYQDSVAGATPVAIDVTTNASECEIAANEERRAASATTPISDSGGKTMFGGIGENAGDPRSTGDWSFGNHPGCAVIDTTNGGLYVWSRSAGGWVPA